ncbi:hypothetical protein R1flu_012123 [Riccia fluitans]|uniref:Uncharacterized protein n=1 Tax=Riccia fluitans TaxID=41844 RepID=A0ABD1ZA25_9MARC
MSHQGRNAQEERMAGRRTPPTRVSVLIKYPPDLHSLHCSLKRLIVDSRFGFSSGVNRDSAGRIVSGHPILGRSHYCIFIVYSSSFRRVLQGVSRFSPCLVRLNILIVSRRKFF